MKIRDFIRVLEQLAPPSFQESYDNAGLIIGSPEMEVTGTLICLDLSLTVIQEAKEKNCNLIISHHPVIFQGLKKINGNSSTEQIVIELIRENIASYAIHTNLDNTKEGINKKLAQSLFLTNTTFLLPQPHQLRKLVTFCPLKDAEKVRAALSEAGAGAIGNYDSCTFNVAGTGTFRANDLANPYVGKKNQLHHEAEIRIETIFPKYLQQPLISTLLSTHPYEEVAYDIYPLENEGAFAGSGIIGDLPKKMPVASFLEFIKKQFKTNTLKYCRGKQASISKVAICSGAGSFLIHKALSSGADAYISADLKYHDFQSMEQQLLLIDAGHFETEVCVKDLLRVALSEKFPNFALLISSKEKNPVNYY
jgi:dinuclear metal center YbgI/SA1388 family protein